MRLITSFFFVAVSAYLYPLFRRSRPLGRSSRLWNDFHRLKSVRNHKRDTLFAITPPQPWTLKFIFDQKTIIFSHFWSMPIRFKLWFKLLKISQIFKNQKVYFSGFEVFARFRSILHSQKPFFHRVLAIFCIAKSHFTQSFFLFSDRGQIYPTFT